MALLSLFVLVIISISIDLAAAGGDVFAHFMIGNAAHMTAQDWSHEVSIAKAAHIDGFALNIAKDEYTDRQLKLAYDAAAASPQGDFRVFISFDYAAAKAQGGFSPTEVEGKINAHKDHPGQYRHGGKTGPPVMSTFEGAENQGDLLGIKKGTGAFMMPDYSSLGPQSAAAVPGVDGLLSWDAWPDGTKGKTPSSASLYKETLGQKPFIMPISPWFYTNLESKNWLWRSDSLWHLSWEEAAKVQPAMIEILTWNDWGESSYISPNSREVSAYPAGSAGYVTPTSHSAWLADLPYYIQQYKQGHAPVEGYKPHITFWHRLSPAASCPKCKCNADYQASHPDGADCDEDAIFVTAFPAHGKIAEGTVTMGGVTKTFKGQAPGPVHTSFPFSAFGGRLGPVQVQGPEMGSARGKPIGGECVAGWNAFVATTAE